MFVVGFRQLEYTRLIFIWLFFVQVLCIVIEVCNEHDGIDDACYEKFQHFANELILIILMQICRELSAAEGFSSHLTGRLLPLLWGVKDSSRSRHIDQDILAALLLWLRKKNYLSRQ